ncbi:hypothetical protein E2C01_045617 [Portunus trituberculatus]|uniref:Uncharacterized protein n=1 Tax=Portunus trituberculatus TaxID=210409 RepID=A0A5B7G5J1_PORTR|nr:hypothetical protein [Portunus trituberculatus]
MLIERKNTTTDSSLFFQVDVPGTGSCSSVGPYSVPTSMGGGRCGGGGHDAYSRLPCFFSTLAPPLPPPTHAAHSVSHS